MKTAIFHNFMDNIGGAEVVSLSLARELEADIYTTNIDADRIMSIGFGDVLPRMHSIGRIPLKAPFRHQIASWRFRRLNLGKLYGSYIICGDWAMSAAVLNKPNLWYVHGPLNELWAYKDFVRKEMMPLWKRPIFELWVWFNRKLTLRYARHVGKWACNSKNSHDRIKRYYGAEASVINPPIYTDSYRWEQPAGYWLSVNRLLPHKRIEMQIEAFRHMPDRKLVIVGSYERGASQFEDYKALLEKDLPPNIEFRYWIGDGELKELYARCTGFIATAKDEDFGMTVVEAMASGKPVIAADEGGYRESVVDGETGILIRDIDAAKLAAAVSELGTKLEDGTSLDRYKRACRKRAASFDIAAFMAKINALISAG